MASRGQRQVESAGAVLVTRRDVCNLRVVSATVSAVRICVRGAAGYALSGRVSALSTPSTLSGIALTAREV